MPGCCRAFLFLGWDENPRGFDKIALPAIAPSYAGIPNIHVGQNNFGQALAWQVG